MGSHHPPTNRYYILGVSVLFGILIVLSIILRVTMAWAILGAVNTTSLFLCGLDKSLARGGKMRIPEYLLLGLALAGGSIGLLSGMIMWRHKTRKRSFIVGLAIILIAQLILFAALPSMNLDQPS